MEVTKRDGTRVRFSLTTLKTAIREAFKATKKVDPDLHFTRETINSIANSINIYDGIKVEGIQDQIETSLRLHDFPKVAKEFILYRDKKRQIREWVAIKQQFIENYKKSTNTANATVDDNSNVASKNIGILNAEIHKSDNIQISRAMIMAKLKFLKAMFPEEFKDLNHKQYVKDLMNHIIYKNDESSFAGPIAPYCVSCTMYPFLLHGLEKIGGLSAKPQNLDSFCGMYINFIFAVASQFAGAVATSEFLVYFNYFAEKEFGMDYYQHLDDFYKVGYKLRRLLNESHYWTSNVTELKAHDFGTDELNALRDEIIDESTRKLTDKELSEWESSQSKGNYFTSHKLGDGTRTIGSTINQFFQQVVYSINQPAASRGMQSASTKNAYLIAA